MSVLVETSAGDLVVDLMVSDAPATCANFVHLCRLKYYHGCLFFNVQTDLLVQTGDPTGTGQGGTSARALLLPDDGSANAGGEEGGAGTNTRRTFIAQEIQPHVLHDRKGLVGMATTGSSSGAGANVNASQFYITTREEDMEHLDGRHTLFGYVAEGMDVLDKLNGLYVDEQGRPYQDVRILHTYVLDDPFPDPEGMPTPPPPSPRQERPSQERVKPRIPYRADGELQQAAQRQQLTEAQQREEVVERAEASEARSHAVVLEMLGDLPDADVKPPDDVLFVCKLNPVTSDRDLDTIFSRFGRCASHVIRDPVTGDSLNYAFVEFESKEACEEAYVKMNHVLVDERRIRVDFSQSVAKLWNKHTRQLRQAQGHRQQHKPQPEWLSGRGRGRGPTRGRGRGRARGPGRGGRGPPGRGAALGPGRPGAREAVGGAQLRSQPQSEVDSAVARAAAAAAAAVLGAGSSSASATAHHQHHQYHQHHRKRRREMDDDERVHGHRAAGQRAGDGSESGSSGDSGSDGDNISVSDNDSNDSSRTGDDTKKRKSKHGHKHKSKHKSKHRHKSKHKSKQHKHSKLRRKHKHHH